MSGRLSFSRLMSAFILFAFLFGIIPLWLLGGFPTFILGNSLCNETDDSDTDKIDYLKVTNMTMPINDNTTLINLKNFTFTMNHGEVCNKSHPFLIFLIHSAPGNFYKRNVIRETWGRPVFSTATFFLIGLSAQHQKALEEENMKHKDLIQGNFVDSYKNLTYKHVMGLKWITYFCKYSPFVLKLDDDVFVNLPVLLQFLEQRRHSPSKENKLIMCHAYVNAIVKRSRRSKYYISYREYPERHFPPYCAGFAIIYSIEAILLLYEEAQRSPYFWIDDVHVSGTLAKKINATPIAINNMILTPNAMNLFLNFRRYRNLKQNHFIFGPPNLEEKEIIDLYKTSISTSV